MLMYQKENLDKDPKVYDTTLRAVMEKLATENPGTTAWQALNWFYGYFGTIGAPCVDTGVFLHHFLQAVEDGLFVWEKKI